MIDEVHRIGSGQYHKALYQIHTPYFLGISATVQRKDKMEKLIFMFMGDVVYSMERKGDELVTVRAIEYQHEDEEYNEVLTDFRGEIQRSTMLSKICNFAPRNVFAMRVIKDLIDENPKSQILVLGHIRCMLEFLYEGLTSRYNLSTGFYVGGMKQKDLDETAETKQVVLSTYMMSSEALDIPTLSILVFVSPKTDIIQCVGRILRKKHDNPIIVDIVDSHSMYQNQWNKRFVYYKKCNYKVVQASCREYKGAGDLTNWKTIFTPYKGYTRPRDKDEQKERKCLIQRKLIDFDKEPVLHQYL